MTTRTWTVDVARYARDYFNRHLLDSLLTIRATDEAEAEAQLVSMLGLSVTPCCGTDPDERPCAECAADLQAAATDRLLDIARDEAALRGRGA